MTFLIVAIVIIGYFLIATENITNLNKASVAMFLGVSGWILYMLNGSRYVDSMHAASYHVFLEGAESTAATLKAYIGTQVFMKYVANVCQVLLFILATMCIVEVLNVHGALSFLKEWMRVRNGKRLLWIVAFLTFIISANLDNLTTAVMMITLLRQVVPARRQRFYYACVIIMAANCGGCFTAIGDVTSVMLWMKGAVTPTPFAAGLVLPAFVSLVVCTALASRYVPDHVELSSTLGAFRGDDFFLNRAQRMSLLIVGIGGLWAIPTFHRVSGLPPFVGALCVLSLLWVITEIYTRRKNDNDVIIYRRSPLTVQYMDIQLLLFLLGISLAVGAIQETGALQQFAMWTDEHIHNIYLVSIVLGFISAFLDNIPLVWTGVSMYPVLGQGTVSAMGGGYFSAFTQDGAYWQVLSYCGSVGGCLLTIGSQAGFAMMRIEKMRMWNYFLRFSWIVFIAWMSGLLVFWLTHL